MTPITFQITFRIRFLTAFRVGASAGRDGVDAPVDRLRPLAADHLKGIIRASARETLRLHPDIVTRVFGSTSSPSPWSWSDAQPLDGKRWEPGYRHRVSINEKSHTAQEGALVLSEDVWAPRAGFEVTWVAAGEPDHDHVLVLMASAAATHAIGAWRRRGLGWVSITSPLADWDIVDARRLIELREAVPGSGPGQGIRSRGVST